VPSSLRHEDFARSHTQQQMELRGPPLPTTYANARELGPSASQSFPHGYDGLSTKRQRTSVDLTTSGHYGQNQTYSERDQDDHRPLYSPFPTKSQRTSADLTGSMHYGSNQAYSDRDQEDHRTLYNPYPTKSQRTSADLTTSLHYSQNQAYGERDQDDHRALYSSYPTRGQQASTYELNYPQSTLPAPSTDFTYPQVAALPQLGDPGEHCFLPPLRHLPR
jgi:hypothetical protein